MILYLIRHGRSFANTKGLVTGTKIDSLNNIGKRQASSTSKIIKLLNITGSSYITSDWKRAQQTANITFPNVQWKIDKRIGETNAGEVSNIELAQFQIEYPTFYDNYRNQYPGGESHKEMNIRVLDFLNELVTKYGHIDKIVIVAHAGPISCMIQHVVGLSMEKFPAFLAHYASLSIVRYDGPEFGYQNQLIAFSLIGSDRYHEYMSLR